MMCTFTIHSISTHIMLVYPITVGVTHFWHPHVSNSENTRKLFFWAYKTEAQTRVNKHSNQKKIEILQRIKEKGSFTEDRKRVFGWSSMTYCTAPLIPMNIDPEWPSLRKILIQLLDLKGKYTGNIQTRIVSDLQGKEN